MITSSFTKYLLTSMYWALFSNGGRRTTTLTKIRNFVESALQWQWERPQMSSLDYSTVSGACWNAMNTMTNLEQGKGAWGWGEDCHLYNGNRVPCALTSCRIADLDHVFNIQSIASCSRIVHCYRLSPQRPKT